MASSATVISGPSALSRMPLLRCSGGVTSATKTVAATRPARAHVADVENRVGKVLDEDARLDLGAELGGFQLVH